MIWLAAAALAASVFTPHLLSQERLPARTGVWLWLGVLSLRAALVAASVFFFVIAVPATGLFSLITHWCIHAVLPFVSAHLGFSGHELGDTATLFPALLVCVSLLSAALGSWKAARAVRAWLVESALGSGPAKSLIVGGSEVLVAAAGVRRPRIIVSAGALARLDDAELFAGLEHERGHIVRHHHVLALIGHLLLALSRALPGADRASFWLHFHLEREADQFAVERTGDPLALASAICKASEGPVQLSPTPAWAGLRGRGATPQRLNLLMKGAPTPDRFATWGARSLAVLMVGATLFVVSATPVIANAAGSAGSSAHACSG